MISIRRRKCPNILKGSPTDGDYYNNSEVLERLWNMQHGKCCYCERLIPREGHGQHVEHFRPKSLSNFKKCRNHWPNLLLACPQCNGHKKDQFPTNRQNQPLLIDPSKAGINPEDHIAFVASDDLYDIVGIPKPLSPRGKKTIEVIGLWLADYIRARNAYFRMAVLPRYERLLRAKQNGDQAALEDAISAVEELMSSRCEFAGFVRSFARNMDLDQRFQVTIPVGSK